MAAACVASGWLAAEDSNAKYSQILDGIQRIRTILYFTSMYDEMIDSRALHLLHDMLGHDLTGVLL